MPQPQSVLPCNTMVQWIVAGQMVVQNCSVNQYVIPTRARGCDPGPLRRRASATQETLPEGVEMAFRMVTWCAMAASFHQIWLLPVLCYVIACYRDFNSTHVHIHDVNIVFIVKRLHGWMFCFWSFCFLYHKTWVKYRTCCCCVGHWVCLFHKLANVVSTVYGPGHTLTHVRHPIPSFLRI